MFNIQCGHQPQVRLYEIQDNTEVCVFAGHKFCIDCVVRL